MIKKITFGFFVFILQSQFLFSQELPENQKLETLCKVWGFLKYYHPNVSKGVYNWDEQLIEKIKQSEAVNTKAEFNAMISEWVDSLGNIKDCRNCNKNTDKKYFLKNFDLNWTSNKNTFTKDVIEKLNVIEKNRNISGQYYVSNVSGTNQITLTNEKDYFEGFPDNNIRLLELFRYWNLVEYFFPYKYQTDQNWNDVLKEMIPKFKNVKNETEYQLILLELVAKIDDSHALYDAKKAEESFGTRYLPIKVKFAENKLVITQIYDNNLGLNYDLKVGDIISKIDNKTIPEIVDLFRKYVPASNENVKILKMIIFNYFFRTNNDVLDLEIERAEKILKVKSPTLNNKNLVSKPRNNDSSKWKIINGDIGFVNMGILEKADIGKMYDELKNSKAIIFDIRNYPKGTAKTIVNLLKKNNFLISYSQIYPIPENTNL